MEKPNKKNEQGLLVKKGKSTNQLLLPFLLVVWILSGIGKVTIRLLYQVIYVLKQKSTFGLVKKISRVLGIILPAPLRIGLALGVFLVSFFAYSFVLIVLAHDLPSPEMIIQNSGPQTTEFYDRNGLLLYRLYEGKNRTAIKIQELPEYLKQATIAIEDKNFYVHSGVDLYGIARALTSIIQNHQVQGGSTITQQLIKNTLLTPERTVQRKLREVVLAFWAERIFKKDEILQMYFNEVPYGGPAWGIAAASQTYFDKKPSELTLSESAYLAGLPASPTHYSPYGTNPEAGMIRQKDVLRRMVEEGFISQQQANEAALEPLNIKPHFEGIKAPHFVMYVRSYLSEKYGERAVSQGGLKVKTTLDLKVQEMAEQVVSEEVAKLTGLNVSNGSAMVTDGRKGEILAMVGSKNYWDINGGNFNVTTALRQPGSSIKPITYATGFKLGYSPGTILLDAPVAYKNAWEVYAPVNYDGKYHGAVSIRTALGSSYNIPAVKMLALVGIPEMIQTAKDLGITTFTEPEKYGLSLTLGGGDIKMVDMMSAYGTFSQLGVRHEIKSVISVIDPSDIVLEDNSSDDGKRVLSPAVAFMIDDILSDNKARTPAFGSNSLLKIEGKTVAVKTGTTDSKRDNWTFGFTPEYVVGVWVGNNNNSPMNQALASGITGAAPIWNRIMVNMIKDRPDLVFNKPAELKEDKVEGNKDLVIRGTIPKSIIGQNKRMIKGPKETEGPKEVITFTDPFSTFQSDNSGKFIVPNNP